MVINTISCVTYINIFFSFQFNLTRALFVNLALSCTPQNNVPFARNLTAKDTIFDMLECVYGNILARTGHCQQKIKPEICIDSGVHSTCTLSPSFWQVYINIQLTTREQFTFQFICRVVRPEFSLFGLSIHCKIYNLRCHIPVQS